MNTIRKAGLHWTIVTRHKRGCTANGRHFGAVRVPGGNDWLLAEIAVPVTTPGAVVLWVRGPFELDELNEEVLKRSVTAPGPQDGVPRAMAAEWEAAS